jgi:predicted amidophosphoribosyltransferase
MARTPQPPQQLACHLANTDPPSPALLCLFCVRPVLDDRDRCAAFAQAGQAAHQSCCGCAAWPDAPQPASSHRQTIRTARTWLTLRGRHLRATITPTRRVP